MRVRLSPQENKLATKRGKDSRLANGVHEESTSNSEARPQTSNYMLLNNLTEILSQGY